MYTPLNLLVVAMALKLILYVKALTKALNLKIQIKRVPVVVVKVSPFNYSKYHVKKLL